MRPLTQAFYMPGELRADDLKELIRAHRQHLGFDEPRLTGRPRRGVLARAVGADGRVDALATQNHDYVTISGPRPPAREVLVDLASLEGFRAAYVGDGEDLGWQEARLLEEYERAGRAADGVVIERQSGRFTYVDTSRNPGRRYTYRGCCLWAAADMYLHRGLVEEIGEDCFDKLAPLAEVGWVLDDVLDLHLYDLGALPESDLREIQQRVVDALRFRELELAWSGEFEPDPYVELVRWPGTAVPQESRVWLDEHKSAAVQRSRASWVQIKSFDEVGRRIATVIEPAAPHRE